jgi:hypothetical protein
MAIITVPPTVTQGVAATLVLDATALLAFAVVQNDTYFIDTLNWKSIAVIYIGKNTNQRKSVLMKDASISTPSGTFKASTKSDLEFELDSITIRDFDNGSITIHKSAFSAQELIDTKITFA